MNQGKRVPAPRCRLLDQQFGHVISSAGVPLVPREPEIGLDEFGVQNPQNVNQICEMPEQVSEK